MNALFWWTRQVILALLAFFFLLFGIYLLIGAYQLKDPFSFIMTFFASNLIILINATLLAGFVVRMIRMVRGSENSEH
ncbi:MAG: hypothetical protein GY849_10710 [Deltaproteobacteria bacterium]|nr:hypothetical protein [Deltaproteobacteria bacterium]